MLIRTHSTHTKSNGSWLSCTKAGKKKSMRLFQCNVEFGRVGTAAVNEHFSSSK